MELFMKKFALKLFLPLLLATGTMTAADQAAPKVGVVNFKSIVESSQIGKQEQANFEALKKQAEQTMQQKEKDLQELATKLQDADYVESLSKEAEADLKHKYRTMSQEILQQQQQLYQTLSQANFKIIQKLQDDVNKAAKTVAEKNNLDMIMNDEAYFYFNKKFDVSAQVVQELDAQFAEKK